MAMRRRSLTGWKLGALLALGTLILPGLFSQAQIAPAQDAPAAKKADPEKKTEAAPASTEESVDEVQERKIRAALKQPVKVDFVETPLGDVIDFLQDTADIPILLNGKALDDDSIAQDTPISLKVQNASLKAVLRLMLRPHHLTAVYRDDVLMITTDAEARSHYTLRCYPIDDLFIKETDTPESLSQTIQTLVQPDSWNLYGGTGTMAVRDRTLIVRNNDVAHEELIEVLARLRDIARRAEAQRALGTPE